MTMTLFQTPIAIVGGNQFETQLGQVMISETKFQ